MALRTVDDIDGISKEATVTQLPVASTSEAVREWHKKNKKRLGLPDIADRGRIPAAIVEAYENAHQSL